MIYRIFLSPGNTGSEPQRQQRRRADAAALAAERIAYDVIASNGGLDTRQGWAIMDKVRALDVRRGGTVEMYGRTLFVTPSVSG